MEVVEEITDLLSYLKNHSNKTTKSYQVYTNVVSFYLPDNIYFPKERYFFPVDHISVIRISNQFIAHHYELMNYFVKQTNMEELRFSEVWLTSFRATKEQKLVIELSFE